MGVTELAAIRPDEWGLPLFLHILGALTLIGAIAVSAGFLVSAWRDGSAASLRPAVRTVAFGVIPAWLVLRASAEWIADKEGFADLEDPPNWIDIGYMVSDAGFLLIVISGVLAWLAYRRADGGSGTMARVAAVLLGLLLVMNLIALWAMTTKPT